MGQSSKERPEGRAGGREQVCKRDGEGMAGRVKSSGGRAESERPR